jgi:recombination protein RecR
MAKKIAAPEIERLIQLLGRLPGLGSRSARKAALALLKRRQDLLICQDPRRDPALVVVVEEIGDLWALERAGVINGRYHVLGGHISPLDGIGPDKLNIASLVARAQGGEVKELLLALNATVEGQSTSHYIAQALEGTPVAISRLAQGVPVGGELDYLDEGTLAAAIKSRKRV